LLATAYLLQTGHLILGDYRLETKKAREAVTAEMPFSSDPR